MATGTARFPDARHEPWRSQVSMAAAASVQCSAFIAGYHVFSLLDQRAWSRTLTPSFTVSSVLRSTASEGALGVGLVCLLFLPLSATTALLAQVAPKWKSDAPGYGVGALCSATLFFHSKFPTLPVWQRGLCSVGTAVGIAGARAFYERRMPELVD